MSKRLENLMFVRELGAGNGTRCALMRDVTDHKHYCKKSVAATAPNWKSQIRQLKTEYDVGIGNVHPALRKSLEYGIVKRKLRPIEAYNILQYVDGLSLDKFAESATLKTVLKIFYHCADGLLELHKRGFIHADLKPLNILCAKNGRPTIIDFGQACPAMHKKERIQGTENFIAKEQVDRKPLDQRTDVFGLGATMHKVLLGRHVETELNRKTGGSISIERIRDSITFNGETLDPMLIKLINDCCEEERANRPTSMQLVKDRLELSFERVAGSNASSATA